LIFSNRSPDHLDAATGKQLIDQGNCKIRVRRSQAESGGVRSLGNGKICVYSILQLLRVSPVLITFSVVLMDLLIDK